VRSLLTCFCFFSCHLPLQLNATSAYEHARLFYLAIPPFAYQSISRSIHRYCRPASVNSSLRTALEKPFGSDLQSAKKLAEEIGESFQPSEIFNVDHYLGKPISRDLMKLRRKNPTLESMLNYKSVARIDVVIRETVDCKGRTGFYNKNGVVRDVLQNHATELLLLTAADLPASENDDDAWEKAKISLLKSLRPLGKNALLTGRYKGYEKHVHEDGGSKPLMPTFATVALEATNHPRWKGVPIVLTSGKRTGSRQSFIRVMFKPPKGCPQSPVPPLGGSLAETFADSSCSPRFLHFHIQGPSGDPPEIRSSAGILVSAEDIQGWTKVDALGDGEKTVRRWRFNGDGGAYDHLVDALFSGERSSFVTPGALMASWELWDSFVKSGDVLEQFEYDEDYFNGLGISATVGKVSIEPALRGAKDSTKYHEEL